MNDAYCHTDVGGVYHNKRFYLLIDNFINLNKIKT